jgi:protein phosphatase 1 regulatory subunit 7
MKYFSLSITILFSSTVLSQIVRIPDNRFKQQVIALGYDLNDDNQIQISEAQKVTTLYLNDLGIVNLEGINSFTNLEELGCYNNKLTLLDVSKLKKLKFLYAYNNRIANLNINGLVQLEHLHIQNNSFITSLDATKFIHLKELNISGNRISKLDVTGLMLLEKIDADDNKISSMKVRSAPNLKHISVKNNPIQNTIDIRGLTYLEYLNCEGCQLLFINFSGTVSLKECFW